MSDTIATDANQELITSDRKGYILSEIERKEQDIERVGFAAFVRTGLELAKIKENEEYKQPRTLPVNGKYSFQTFDEYVQARFGFKYEYAYRLITAAKAMEEMSETLTARQTLTDSQGIEPVKVLPANEYQVRPLLKLDNPDERLDVWQKVLTKDVTITGPVVTKAVERHIKVKNKDYQTIEEWKADPWPISFDGKGKFNEQPGTAIEWARWSFNPITGCRHGCTYCYAEAFQNRHFPEKKFAPARHPGRYAMPKNTLVPEEAEFDTSYKNVFVGSMADMFGRWVPKEWIYEVIESAVDNPQWNYLFLSKFPNRYQEFHYPENVWLGTSVDCQARVAVAEKAFENVTGTTWLSVEPMLTPLKFKHLDRFDWLVIGGASAQAQMGTPAWVPPMDWIMDLYQQGREAGCKIYFKDNLPIGDELRVKEFPWEDAPVKELPEVFNYIPLYPKGWNEQEEK